jgi:hypothetical protein
MFNESITPVESPHIQEKNPSLVFDIYKNEIHEIINHINDIKLDRYQSLQDFIGDVQYKISPPHARPGKHAKVFFLDISKPNEPSFEAVLRNSPSVAEDYKKNIKDKPILDKYLPKLYGVENGWVIMERLKGLELGELEKKLKSDENFFRQYVKNSTQAMYELSSTEVVITDVQFASGHNCIVNENDASVRIIEQDNLRLEKDFGNYSPNESLVSKLWNQLENTSYFEPNLDNEWRYDFAFQLTKNILSKTNPKDLEIKYRYLKPSHEWFRSTLDHQLWIGGTYKKLSDEDYEKILLKNPNITCRAPSGDFTEGFVLNEELAEAVSNNDIENFKRLIRGKFYKSRLEDNEKNRVILE